jgi:lipopolysaccharide/colanic/teichoic acid biosynthesis glycosyltransferase
MLAKESRVEAGGATHTPSVQQQSNGSAALAAPRLHEPRLARPAPALRADAVAKRALDVVASLFLLVVLAPVILIVAALVRLESYGPAFYRAPRVGFGGHDLWMLKFRKMHHWARGIPLTLSADDRLTRLGTWLARFKLDELPQLWHVLRGDMSLVGPRPETVEFVHHHREAYREILSVRPGVFGFSQLAFVAEGRILDEEDPMTHYVTDILPQKVKLDLMYTRERTVGLDVRILFWSAIAVLLRRQVAVNRKTGRMNLRRR